MLDFFENEHQLVTFQIKIMLFNLFFSDNRIFLLSVKNKSELNTQFWLWNVVFLPREAGRVSGMES